MIPIGYLILFLLAFPLAVNALTDEVHREIQSHVVNRRQRAQVLIAANASLPTRDRAQPPTERTDRLHNALNTATTLSKLRPAHHEYERLRRALVQYHDMAAQGGWPMLPNGPTLHQGDRDLSVALLRLYLQATGDLASESTQNRTFFDERLAGAVRRFQYRHGLVEDGIVGSNTRAALQVPIEDRVHQLSRNLDRLRGFPRDPGPRHIRVNIPAFTLQVMEHDQPVMTMRVVVGKPSWPTPVLHGRLSALVFNPYWYIPPRIVQQEIIPRQRRDPSYLATHHISLIQGHGHQVTEIAPNTIDWSRIPSHGIPYRFRQRPGPTNPLGRIKFTMPNPLHITLHDTPSRALFEQTARAKSHGCIRLEKPIALAEYLLRENSTWTRAAIMGAIGQQTPRHVPLPAPIPVYLTYHTAWVDQDGVVHFRPDIYGWDTASISATVERSHDACGSGC